ncbi:MAG: AMP-binding protein, partial [bacterium]|nr:AMP-binding protein [bacterium]
MRDTCVDQFFNRVNKYPGMPAYFESEAGKYVPTTWHGFGENVSHLASGFIALGLAKGQCVVTLSFNRSEWITSSMAAQACGGVCVGVYNSCSAEEVEYILKHSEAPILVLENGKRWREQVEPIVQHLQSLKHVILIEPDDIVQEGLIKTFAQVLEMGKNQPSADLDERIKSIKVEDTATFIYTSGTTGAPKAVELSHKAVDWTVTSAVKLLKVRQEDTLVSYLPLAHVAEKMFTIYAPLYSGMNIYFADSVENMPENLKTAQPTVFFGVPRVYEKFYEKVSQKLNSATGIKSLLLKWARSVAMMHWEYDHQNALVPPLVSIQYVLAKRLVFNKLKPLLGLGKARACISGAAPISVDIIKFFMSIDVPIYEVYGQSEDCGPTTFNLPKATKLGTVGRALPGVEMKIASDGEIIVRGPHLFKGYYKDEA